MTADERETIAQRFDRLLFNAGPLAHHSLTVNNAECELIRTALRAPLTALQGDGDPEIAMDRAEPLVAELRQCETELVEAANLLRAAKLPGTGGLYEIAASRVRKAILGHYARGREATPSVIADQSERTSDEGGLGKWTVYEWPKEPTDGL